MLEPSIAQRVAPGACASLWTPRSMAATLTPSVRRILSRARPQIVCLHGMPESLRLYAKSVWNDLQAMATALPVEWKPRLWIGVACDTPIALTANRHQTYVKSMLDLLEGAHVANDLGAEIVIWNAESACKIDPQSTRAIASNLIERTRDQYPHLVQGHTSYGIPTNHSETDAKGNPLPHGYPWSAWCGPQGVDIEFNQDYAAPEQPEDGPRMVAGRGALAARIRHRYSSWNEAVSRGWARKGLLCFPYVQLHHVPFVQTATYATDPEYALRNVPSTKLSHTWIGWTVEKDRCDSDGETALCIGSELFRRNKTITEIQREAGIAADGIAGPDTARVLNIEF